MLARTRKAFFTCSIILFAFFAARICFASAAVEHIVEFEITLSGSTVKSGSQLPVVCSIKNISMADLVLPVKFLPVHHFIRFVIEDPDGKSVPFNGPEIKVDISTKNIVLLEPQMFIGKEIDVTGQSYGENWYSLLKKGQYRIRAVYEVPEYWRKSLKESDLWTGKVVSNTVIFDLL